MLILLLACSHTPPQDASAIRPPAPPHAGATERARDSLLFNDFAGWTSALTDAAADTTLPADARLKLTAAATTADLGSASTALGELTVSCAACHTSVKAQLRTPPSWEVDGDGVRAEMERHAQGMEQIWYGVIAPSPMDLATGAHTLRQSLLYLSKPDAGGAGEVLDEEVSTAADAVAAARTAEATGAAFAHLLRTCATCHAARPGGMALEPE